MDIFSEQQFSLILLLEDSLSCHQTPAAVSVGEKGFSRIPRQCGTKFVTSQFYLAICWCLYRGFSEAFFPSVMTTDFEQVLDSLLTWRNSLANNYLFKVNVRNARMRCEIQS